MAKQTLNTLKNWFKTGLKPTQAQFWDMFDSFFHKDDKVPITSVDGLQTEFDKKVDKGAIALSDVDGLDDALSDINTAVEGKEEVGVAAELITQEISARNTAILAAINALKSGAPEAYDTLIEIANKLDSEDGALAAMLTTIAGKENAGVAAGLILAANEYNWEVLSGYNFGRLYNGYAVADSRNIAPVGWHVATQAEWQTLSDYLGGDLVSAGKLKEIGTTSWKTPNSGATDSVGFKALASGYRPINGDWLGPVSEIKYSGRYWCADNAHYRYLYYANTILYGGTYDQKYGLAVRCVRDSGNSATSAADLDGNLYTSVTIGTQTWMVENLKTTKYRTGESIATVTTNAAWAALIKGAYCNFNDVETMAVSYIQPKFGRYIKAGNLGTASAKNVQDFATAAQGAKADLALQISDITGLQPKTDNILQTTDKTVTGAINEVRTIALGADIAFVFDTKAALDAALLDPTFVATLKVGNLFLIRAVSTPDYWFDGITALELEVKIDLANYYTKSQIDTLLNDKQNNLSFSTDIEADKASTTKVGAIKVFYEWATNLFAKLSGAIFIGEVSIANGLKVTKIYPNADGTTAVQFTKADGTTVVFNIDTSGARPIIRIGTTSVAGSSTPTVFSLGGSYSTTKGYFPKLKLYDDGTNYFGLGVSANCYELMAPSDAYFSFVVNKIEKAKITSAGGLVLASSCQVGDDTAAASSANVGTTRYRVSGNNSYYETCMQTGASTYAWYINKQYSW